MNLEETKEEIHEEAAEQAEDSEQLEEATAEDEREEDETADVEDEDALRLEALEGKLRENEDRYKENEDRYKRLLAEFENFKRRNRQETDQRLKFAQQPLALSVIHGLDDLERAIRHAKDEEGETDSEFVKGVEMVYQGLLKALGANHVEKIESLGEPFDPNKHEAMGMIDSDSVEPDHVATVFQAGYTLHDRVIRPAKVQVAKKK